MSNEFKVRIARMGKRELAEALRKTDREALSDMSDIELAIWESEQQPGSPQALLARFEWDARLVKRQVEATIRSARMGICGALAGAIVGALLGAGLTWYISARLAARPAEDVVQEEEERHQPRHEAGDKERALHEPKETVHHGLARSAPAPVQPSGKKGAAEGGNHEHKAQEQKR